MPELHMNRPALSRIPQAPRSGIPRRILCALLAGMVTGAVLWPGGGPVAHTRSGFQDWLVRLAPKPDPGIPFGLVLIDSSSMELDHVPPEEMAESPDLVLMAEGWPWPRSVYASVIRKMLDAGARLVILDVLLLGEREGDEALRQVIRDHPDRIVLVSNCVEEVSGDGHTIERYQEPLDGNLPEGTNVGFANFLREDGVVRTAPFRIERPGGGTAWSSPATALGLLKGPAARDALPPSAKFIPCIEGMAPDLRIPIWQVFARGTWERNLRNGETFRDRVIAIGASAPQFHDEFETPVGVVVGAGLHLGALGAAIEGAFYSGGGSLASALGGICGAVLLLLIWCAIRLAWLRVIVILLAAGAAIGLSVPALTLLGWMPPTFGILAGGSMAAFALLGSDLVVEGRERRRARKILERYVSPEITREILDSSSDFLASLGGVNRDVTVLFSDLRGFTAQSQDGDPSRVVEQLNEYFSLMVDEILRTGGWVDKFMGDGILAVWGTLGRRTPAEDAAGALASAKAMREALETLNASREARGLPHWKLGIGIHSGPALFGNLGSQAKMEPTVIGDTVNLASRIEGCTKALGTEILFSAATGSAADIDSREAERVRVVGRTKPVDLCTFWPAAFGSSLRDAHTRGIAAFRNGDFATAATAFEQILASIPHDPLATLYRERCTKLATQPTPKNWDGAITATSK